MAEVCCHMYVMMCVCVFEMSCCSQANASARVVNQLLSVMDGVETRGQVFIMGATNRPGCR